MPLKWSSATVAFLAALTAMPCLAQDLTPLDTTQVEEGLMLGVFGPWYIRDESGARACTIVLGEEPAGKGRKIAPEPACPAIFPVIARVASWQLYENWVIDLMDADGKTLIRFTTPDDTYIADPETDGIHTIEMEFGG